MNNVGNPFSNPRTISYFFGVRGLDTGIDRAAGQCRTVAYVEIEAFTIANLLEAMQAGKVAAAPIWCNVKSFNAKPFRGKVDGIIGGYPCFAAGTRILTSEGNKRIEEIRANDLVLTHKGRWRRVTHTMCRPDAATRIIKGHGVPSTTTTDEHPYFARKRSENPEWINSANILCGRGGNYLSQILPEESKFSEYSRAFWWVIGRYIADGYSQWSPSRRHKKGGRITICCGKHKADELESVLTECGFKFTKSEGRTAYKYAITQHWIYEFVQQFGSGASEKHLSRTIFELPTSIAKSFIEGYLSGDGSKYKDKSGAAGWSATTSSLSLALDIALLAQRTHGVVASIKEEIRPEKYTIEGRIVNQRNTYSIRIPDKNRSAFIEGEYGWKLAKKNFSTNERNTVYNISVEEDESYVANGAIVHNCQPFSMAGKRNGTEDPRHLYPYLERDIRAIRPVWCFFENVAGHLNLGFDQVYASLSGMGYAVEAGIFTAEEVGAPHERKRLFILAIRKDWLEHATKQGLQVGRQGGIREFQEETAFWLDDRPQFASEHAELADTYSSGGGKDRESGELRTEGIEQSPGNSGGSDETQDGQGWEDRWPARPGEEQYEWEEPRTVITKAAARLLGGYGKKYPESFPAWQLEQVAYNDTSGTVKPEVGCTVDGYDLREDLLRAYGNGVVPQVAELAFRILLDKHLNQTAI